MNDADEEMKKMLKHKRFLFLKNIENLESDGKQELEKLKEMFSDLGTATFMKECLRRIYSIAENKNEAKIAFEDWCKIADETGIGSLANMAKTIRRHLDGILAYWTEGKLTSAGMEGFNNKLRWLIGQAYGYRDDSYTSLKKAQPTAIVTPWSPQMQATRPEGKAKGNKALQLARPQGPKARLF